MLATARASVAVVVRIAVATSLGMAVRTWPRRADTRHSPRQGCQVSKRCGAAVGEEAMMPYRCLVTAELSIKPRWAEERKHRTRRHPPDLKWPRGRALSGLVASRNGAPCGVFSPSEVPKCRKRPPRRRTRASPGLGAPAREASRGCVAISQSDLLSLHGIGTPSSHLVVFRSRLPGYPFELVSLPNTAQVMARALAASHPSHNPAQRARG